MKGHNIIYVVLKCIMMLNIPLPPVVPFTQMPPLTPQALNAPPCAMLNAKVINEFKNMSPLWPISFAYSTLSYLILCVIWGNQYCNIDTLIHALLPWTYHMMNNSERTYLTILSRCWFSSFSGTGATWMYNMLFIWPWVLHDLNKRLWNTLILFLDYLCLVPLRGRFSSKLSRPLSLYLVPII